MTLLWCGGTFFAGLVIGTIGTTFAMASLFYWMAHEGHVAALNKFRAKWRTR